MKVLIVGAGPIGCYTARLLKQRSRSLKVLIIEEHPELGRPIHCAGLVGKRVFEETKVPIDEGAIINRIDGARLWLDDDSFQIKKKDVALVIDRERFDRFLGKGLDIVYNTKFVGLEKEGSGYLVETDKGEIYADIIIGADGATSSVRKAVGLEKGVSYHRGVQFRIAKFQRKSSFVEVYIKKPSFAWIIPEDTQVVRIGVICENPYHDLQCFLREKGFNGDILDKFAGMIPVGNCQTQIGNLALVGDAACQVKPLTHGGIYYGMRCAEILAGCIFEGRIHDYEKEWRQRFEREIHVGSKVKTLYGRLSEEDLLKVFGLLKKSRFLLERFGDFEDHVKVMSKLLKIPRFQKYLVRILPTIIKDIVLD